jgi:hypothetical protein
MHPSIIAVIVLTFSVFTAVLSVIVLTIVEASKSHLKSERESFNDPNDVHPMSDIEDEILDQNISLKYFQRGRSSLTELYMNSNSDINNGQQSIYTISLTDQSPKLQRASVI